MIKIDEYNYDLKQFNEMIQKSEIEFSFWGGRKIVLSASSQKLSFHYNHILNSLLQINPNQLTSKDIPTLNVLTRRFRKLENEGHESNSFKQRFYNLFRRFIPNFFRENKIKQLENFTLLRTNLIFDEYVDCLLDLKEKKPIYRDLIPMLDASNTEEERTNLLLVFLQRLNAKTAQIDKNPLNFLKVQSFVNEINKSFSLSFARCKENNSSLLASMNYKLQPLDNLARKTFEDLELERMERHFSDGSRTTIDILNSIKEKLSQEDRFSLLKNTKCLTNGISNKLRRMEILEKTLQILPKMDKKDRCSLIEALRIFVDDLSVSDDKRFILSKFLEILIKNGENFFSVVESVTSYTNAISIVNAEFDIKLAVLELMQNFLEEQNVEQKLSLVKNAVLLMNGISEKNNKLIILQAAEDLFKEENSEDRLSIIENAKILMNGVTDVNHKVAILQAVTKLFKEKDSEDKILLIKGTQILMDGISSGLARLSILEVIADLPKEKNVEDTLSLIKDARILMDDISSGYIRAQILQAVAEKNKELTNQNRLSVIKNAKALMDGISDGGQRIAILEAVVEATKKIEALNFFIALVQQKIKIQMRERPLDSDARINILNETIQNIRIV